MSDKDTRLVLRRTDIPKGNKILVRLDPAIDRSSNLYSLFRDGVVIEVLDIDAGDDTRPPLATVGVTARPGFRIDRGEKVTAPRTEDEVGGESCVVIAEIDDEELRRLTLDELDSRISELRSIQTVLRGQLNRLKADKTLANDRGYRHKSNDNYHRWVMINDEIEIVKEQLDKVTDSISQATSARKTVMFRLNNEARTTFQDLFVRAAKDSLPEKTFLKLKAIAESQDSKAVESRKKTA